MGRVLLLGLVEFVGMGEGAMWLVTWLFERAFPMTVGCC